MKKFTFRTARFVRVSIGLILTIGFLQITFASAQALTNTEKNPLWQSVSEENIANRGERHLNPERYKVFRLDQAALNEILEAAPLEFSSEARQKEIVLTVPKPDGTLVRFRLEESPILSPHIAAQHPTWKTFQGYGIDEPATTARFDWTDRGFHGYIMATEGTYSIDPYQTNDRENYLVFYKNQFGNPVREFHCKLDELFDDEQSLVDSFTKQTNLFDAFTHGAQIRTYRLAVATTFEYTNFFRQGGDTDEQAQTRALNQVVISVNRINAVYRKELAVSFTLVSGTNLTYVVNPETPANYNNNGSSADLTANQTNLNSIIGSENYDVGHVFQTGFGGVATLSSVCGSSKARGLSGLPNPTGDPFDVDFVAHELGHQFGANHTFNATSDCGSSPSAARKEPGSAVTIMGYAGICSSTANIQRNSIDIFHVHNLTESINFLTSGAGSTCGVLAGSNAAPVITPLSNYTIPFNTPFELTVSATDADNDPLTYNWEQNDAGVSASNYPAITDDDDISLVFRPGFRSYLPTTSPTRSFPSLTYILNNSNEAPITFIGTSDTGSICAGECITGEDLPSEARTMNFRVSVRDGNGGITDAGTVVTVINTTTPFKVTTQNSSPTAWAGNSSQTVTWDVSGTTGGGINTANVKISLSTDGGQTFPTVLAASTPNDGSHVITVPPVLTTTARIKVEAVGNIFFDINDADFSITEAIKINNVPFFDFDGDGRTDLGIFRPSVGEWWYLRSSDGGNRAFQFGEASDKIVAADYTGDEKADIAIFRPSSGEWFVLRSEDNSFYSFPFGMAGDIPTPADFDGDGKADPAVYRPSNSTWYYIRSSNSQAIFFEFGGAGDMPVAADYDGDGEADIAIFRPSNGTWWIHRSSGGTTVTTFGTSTDKAVPADYTGDGKTDVAIYRPSTGEWFILRSEDSSYYSVPFGAVGDIPTPGDYDGDGTSDLAIFRPSTSTWYLLQSTSGFTALTFGADGDVPIPNAYVR